MAPQTTALGDEVRTGRFVRRRSDFRDHPPTAEAGRYQRPGIAATVAMDQIRRHYYTTHDSLEPSRIIPIGPELDFLAPHGRDARAATGAPTRTTQRRAA